MRVKIGNDIFELPFRYTQGNLSVLDANGDYVCEIFEKEKGQAIADALNEKFGGWISVKERLPEIHAKVLWQKRGRISIGYRSIVDGLDVVVLVGDSYLQVVDFEAWRPLPLKYEGE